MWVGGQSNAPAALPPGKTRYPLYRRRRGPHGQCGKSRHHRDSIHGPPARSVSLTHYAKSRFKQKPDPIIHRSDSRPFFLTVCGFESRPKVCPSPIFCFPPGKSRGGNLKRGRATSFHSLSSTVILRVDAK